MEVQHRQECLVQTKDVEDLMAEIQQQSNPLINRPLSDSGQVPAAPLRTTPDPRARSYSSEAQTTPQITAEQLKALLRENPDLIQSLAQEMNQAATAMHAVPQSSPAHAAQATPIAKMNDTSAEPTSKKFGLQNAMQSLVTLPNQTPPSSPFGVGEMIQAAKAEITSLDTHADLYKTDFSIARVTSPRTGVKAASSLYQEQSEVEPVVLEKDLQRKNNSATQERIAAMHTMRLAINEALAPLSKPMRQGAPSSPAPATPSKQTASLQNDTIQPKPAPANDKGAENKPTTLEERKEDILPYAEKYARKLGYSPEKGETEKILVDTVNFYSKNDALSRTLKTLVAKLPDL